MTTATAIWTRDRQFIGETCGRLDDRFFGTNAMVPDLRSSGRPFLLDHQCRGTPARRGDRPGVAAALRGASRGASAAQPATSASSPRGLRGFIPEREARGTQSARTSRPVGFTIAATTDAAPECQVEHPGMNNISSPAQAVATPCKSGRAQRGGVMLVA